MVKRARPCPYCGEYGIESPGVGCCGGSSYKEPEDDVGCSLAAAFLGLGGLVSTLLGARFAEKINEIPEMEGLVNPETLYVAGGLVTGAVYTMCIGGIAYLLYGKKNDTD